MSPTPDSTDEFLPATATELGRWVAENDAGPARPLYPAGGRTAVDIGLTSPQPGIRVSTTELTKVIDYPARDMTITVEAGIRISELAEILATEKQRLAVDVALPRRATLGGVVAANASGPRRFGWGTIRDYVLGVSAVDAAGRLFKAGGRVVKNVAGYDVCKVLVGSHGTLAIITQLTLKLRPIPESSGVLWCAFDHFASIEQALVRLSMSSTRPIAVELLEARAAAEVVATADLDLPAHRPVLCLGVEGTGHETTWQLEQLRGEMAAFGPHSMTVVPSDDVGDVWTALTEFQIASDDPLTFKASLLPSQTVEFVQKAEAAGCSLQAHAANGIVIGHLPDAVTSAAAANALLTPLRQMTARSQGSLLIEQCDDAWKRDLARFGEPPPAARWMQALKRQLDPRNLLNPGRLGEAFSPAVAPTIP